MNCTNGKCTSCVAVGYAGRKSTGTQGPPEPGVDKLGNFIGKYLHGSLARRLGPPAAAAAAHPQRELEPAGKAAARRAIYQESPRGVMVQRRRLRRLSQGRSHGIARIGQAMRVLTTPRARSPGHQRRSAAGPARTPAAAGPRRPRRRPPRSGCTPPARSAAVRSSPPASASRLRDPQGISLRNAGWKYLWYFH